MRTIKCISALCSAALLLTACNGDDANSKSTEDATTSAAATSSVVSEESPTAAARAQLVEVPFENFLIASGDFAGQYFVGSPDGLLNCALGSGSGMEIGFIICDSLTRAQVNMESNLPNCTPNQFNWPSRFMLHNGSACQDIIQGWTIGSENNAATVPLQLQPGSRVNVSPTVGCFTDNAGEFFCANDTTGLSYKDGFVSHLTPDQLAAVHEALAS